MFGGRTFDEDDAAAAAAGAIAGKVVCPEIIDQPTKEIETMKMALKEFNAAQPIMTLWICGHTCPAGETHHQYTDTDCEEDYCDLQDDWALGEFGDLLGDVDGDRWSWDGSDHPTSRNNGIGRIVADR